MRRQHVVRPCASVAQTSWELKEPLAHQQAHSTQVPTLPCRQELPQPQPSMAALAVEGMSLDRFMAKHTSEDNASFAQIMEESNKRRRLSKPWLFEQKDKVSTPLSPCITCTGACAASALSVSAVMHVPPRLTRMRSCCWCLDHACGDV